MALQMELVDYIIGVARFFDCQFIISSHSPFFLSIPFAKIYDMDCYPVKIRKRYRTKSFNPYCSSTFFAARPDNQQTKL